MRRFRVLALSVFLFVVTFALVPTLTFAQNWQASGSMSTPRTLPAAVALADGRVLIMGGTTDGSGSGALDSVDIHDPATGTTVIGPPLPYVAYAPTPIRLLDGRVALIGGFVDSPLDNMALYNPATNSWTSGPTVPHSSALASMTLLPDGRLLVAGGADSGLQSIKGADIYDPVANSWTTVADTNEDHYLAASVTLADGRFMIIGGSGSSSAEIYNLAANTWTLTGAKNFEDSGASSAMRLSDGRILHIGGLGQVDVYDPALDTWTAGPPSPMATFFHGAVEMDGDRMMLFGGLEVDRDTGNQLGSEDLSSSMIYDVASSSWSDGPSTNAPHTTPGVAALGSNRFVIAGSYISPNTTIERIGPNHAPVADAGPNQNASTCDSCVGGVTLNGNGSSDPDGDAITTYIWSEGTTVLATTTQATTIVALSAGTHVLTLTVRDVFGAEGTDTMTVVVTNVEDGWRAQVASLQAQNASLQDQVTTLTASNAILQAQLAACQASGGSGNPTPAMDSLEGYMRTLFGDPAFELPGATGLDELQQLIAALKAMPPGQVKQLYRSLGGKK